MLLQTVYRNIFNEKKYVEVYEAKDAQSELGLSRDEFIALAFFLGSDYTDGITGVGIVNALEILQAFDMRQVTIPDSDAMHDSARHDEAKNAEHNFLPPPESGLRRFRKWLEEYNPADSVDGIKKAKLKHHNSLEDIETESAVPVISKLVRFCIGKHLPMEHPNICIFLIWSYRKHSP
jgi:5'-3' exonuclease